MLSSDKALSSTSSHGPSVNQLSLESIILGVNSEGKQKCT